jgi:hypothetical protein
MRIQITGLRYPPKNKNHKDYSLIGKSGRVTGNAYHGWEFWPDNGDKWERYDTCHYYYIKLG